MYDEQSSKDLGMSSTRDVARMLSGGPFGGVKGNNVDLFADVTNVVARDGADVLTENTRPGSGAAGSAILPAAAPGTDAPSNDVGGSPEVGNG